MHVIVCVSFLFLWIHRYVMHISAHIPSRSHAHTHTYVHTKHVHMRVTFSRMQLPPLDCWTHLRSLPKFLCKSSKQVAVTKWMKSFQITPRWQWYEKRPILPPFHLTANHRSSARTTDDWQSPWSHARPEFEASDRETLCTLDLSFASPHHVGCWGTRRWIMWGVAKDFARLFFRFDKSIGIDSDGCCSVDATRFGLGFQSYHKSCFRCQSCSKGLDSTILCQHEEDIYCKGIHCLCGWLPTIRLIVLVISHLQYC